MADILGSCAGSESMVPIHYSKIKQYDSVKCIQSVVVAPCVSQSFPRRRSSRRFPPFPFALRFSAFLLLILVLFVKHILCACLTYLLINKIARVPAMVRHGKANLALALAHAHSPPDERAEEKREEQYHTMSTANKWEGRRK